MSNNDKSQSIVNFSESTLHAQEKHALEALRTTATEHQESLIQAWVKNSNVSAVHAVSEDASMAPSLRKSAKRGLAVLKSRGLTTTPVKANVTSLFSEPEYTLEARCMFPDSDGSQIWWILKSSSLGKHDLVEVTTNDRGGLTNLKYGYPKGASIRQLWHSLEERTGRVPVSVSVEYARFRIASAYQTSLARNAVLPMGIDATYELLGDLKSPLQTMAHPIETMFSELPTDESAIQSRLAKTLQLHQLPEFNSWIPESSASMGMMQVIDEKVAALQAKGEEDLEQTRTQLSDIINQATRDAANAYFNEERKHLYIARLHDAAWSLAQSNQKEDAIDALLIANAIKEAGIVSNQPCEVPFLLGMFVKFVLHVQQHIAARNRQASNQAEASV